MKKVFLIFAMLTLLTTCELSTAYAFEHKKSTDINVAMSVWQGWYVVNVADVKGFWKKEGLNVKVINFDSCYNMLNDMKDNDVDIGVDMLGTWFSDIALLNEPIKVIGSIDNSYGGDMIISRDNQIKKGSKVFVYSDMLPTMFFFDEYLKSVGSSISDFKIIRYDSEYIKIKFADKRVDTIINYGDNAESSLVEGGIKLADTSKFKDVMPEGMCIFDKSYKRIGSDNMVKFWKGYTKALKWASAKENEKEVRSIIKKYTLKNEQVTEKDLDKYLSQVHIYNSDELSEKNTTSLKVYSKNINEFCKKYKIVSEGIDFYTKVDTSDLKKALGGKE